jgi:hypothetical protein
MRCLCGVPYDARVEKVALDVKIKHSVWLIVMQLEQVVTQ